MASPVEIERPGKDAGNSSSTPLTGGASFIGRALLNEEPDLFVTCKTDQDGTLIVEFSTDNGENFDSSVSFAVTGGVNEFHTLVKGTRMHRVSYTNGSVAQTYMRLHTETGIFRQPNSSLSTPIQQDSDASTVRAITEEIAISAGLFTGYSIVNKFGTNSDIDTATVPEDIFEGGGTYAGFPDTTLETISVVSSSANDASAGTGARTIQVTGLDTNYNVVTDTITLNGLTPAAGTVQFRRCHTATIQTVGSGGVNAGDITIRHTTTTANVFAVMLAGRNQTNCSCYTVPAGYTAYMRRIHGAIRGGTTAVLDGYIWTRAFGRPFRARRPFTISTTVPLEDIIYGGLPFTEKSDVTLRITAASANNVAVAGGYDLVLVKNTS